MTLLLLAFAIILVAAATQAVTGFGYALLAMPLLTVAADPRTAVVSGGIAGLVMTITTTVRERSFARWRTAGLLLAASVLGMPAGLLVLRLAPEQVLTALIGVAVVACAVLVWRGLRIATGRPAMLGVGVLTGALSTSTGANGPPLVAAFQAMGYDPRTFRATLAVVFAGTGVLSVFGFVLTGQATPEAVRVGLVGVPAVLIGWSCGNVLFQRLDASRFRRLVLGALVVGGAVIVVRALIQG